MKKPLLIIGLLIGIIIALTLVQVWVSNRISTTGITLAKISDEISSYKRENALLSEDVLVNSSLTQIASSAAELGFVDVKSSVYINAPLPLAVVR